MRHLCSSDFLRTVKALGPECEHVVWENVKGSMCAFWWRGKYIWPFLTVLIDLVDLGFQVRPMILTAAHFGCPNTRQRCVILGARKCATLPGRPRCTHHFDVSKSRVLPQWRPLLVQSGPHLPAALTRLDAISDLPEPAVRGMDPSGYGTGSNNSFQETMRHGNASGDLHGHRVPENVKQASLFDGRCDANMSQPADTVPCKYSIDWKCCYKEQDRLFTTRESARFQSWPDRFAVGETTAAQQRNLGNMVPPLMATAIGRAIIEARKDQDLYA